MSRIFQSGWKALKWSGTFGPKCSITQSQSAPISLGSSLWPGMTSVVISNQMSVSRFRYCSVSKTGPSDALQSFL